MNWCTHFWYSEKSQREKKEAISLQVSSLCSRPDSVVSSDWHIQAQHQAAPTSFLPPALPQTGRRLCWLTVAETATSSTDSTGIRLQMFQTTWCPKTWQTSSPWQHGWNTGPVWGSESRRKPYCVTLTRLVRKQFHTCSLLRSTFPPSNILESSNFTIFNKNCQWVYIWPLVFLHCRHFCFYLIIHPYRRQSQIVKRKTVKNS